jgi:hypothetical protein
MRTTCHLKDYEEDVLENENEEVFCVTMLQTRKPIS